jgi:hypothetical protein
MDDAMLATNERDSPRALRADKRASAEKRKTAFLGGFRYGLLLFNAAGFTG